MRVGNSKTALFSGAVGRKILVPFLVRKVRRRLMGFQGPLPLSFHPQVLGERGEAGGRDYTVSSPLCPTLLLHESLLSDR